MGAHASSSAPRREKSRLSRGTSTSSITTNPSSRPSTNSSASEQKTKLPFSKKKRKKAGFIANRYVLGEPLGQGASALVKSCTDNATGAIRAVKIVDVRLKDRFGSRGAVDHERLKVVAKGEGIWKRIGDHANCVKLLDSVLHKGWYYMVMERYDASLKDKLCVLGRESEASIAHVFREMLSGIHRVHEVGVIHRDVKPNNFLVKSSNEHCQRWCVKLCDFGQSTYLPSEGMLHNHAGTKPFMSPEMLDNRGYTEKTDIWSFGVTAYMMVCKEFPYWQNEAPLKEADMVQAIIQGRPKPRFLSPSMESDKSDKSRKPLSAELIGFLQLVLQRSCTMRCTAEEALKHDFLGPKSRLAKSVPASSSGSWLCDEDLTVQYQHSAPAYVDAGPKVKLDPEFLSSDGCASVPTYWSTRAQECKRGGEQSPISSHTIPRTISRSSDRSGSARSRSSSHSSQRNGGDSQTASHYDISLRLESDNTCVSTTTSPRSLGSLSEEVYQRPTVALTPCPGGLTTDTV